MGRRYENVVSYLSVSLCCFAVDTTVAHVPTYNGCVDNCCTPPHHHTTSQVIYLRGSGGLEIHFTDDGPFDLDGNETIDIDAVFKYEYDPSTYALYIGCGGECYSCIDQELIRTRSQLHSRAFRTRAQGVSGR